MLGAVDERPDRDVLDRIGLLPVGALLTTRACVRFSSLHVQQVFAYLSARVTTVRATCDEADRRLQPQHALGYHACQLLS